MWANKTTTAGPCMINGLSAKNSRRNSVKGTETKNLPCSITDRWQTSLDTGCTVVEHGGRRYCTHRFGTGKYVLCGKQKKIIRLPRLLCSAFYTYSSQKLPEVRLSSIAKNLVLENRDESALRGHVASVSPTFN